MFPSIACASAIWAVLIEVGMVGKNLCAMQALNCSQSPHVYYPFSALVLLSVIL